MTRNFFEFHGKPVDPDVAYIVCSAHDRRVVTYTQIREERKKRQREHLALIRRISQEEHTVPAHIWVFYNDTDIYGGWWIYLRTLRNSFPLNFRGSNVGLIESAMRLFPCGVFPKFEFFREWAAAFAEMYPNKFRKRKKEGLALIKCRIGDHGRPEELMTYTRNY